MSPDTFSLRLPLWSQVSLVLSIPSADTALTLFVTDDFPVRVWLPLYQVPITLQAIRKSRFTYDVSPNLRNFLKYGFIGRMAKFYHDRDPACNTDPDTVASRVPHKYRVRQSVPPRLRA
jgi:hypothetical protein